MFVQYGECSFRIFDTLEQLKSSNKKKQEENTTIMNFDDVVNESGTANKWIDDTGKTIWPPNNGAVEGSEKMINLNKGATFGRIGDDTGSFVAPPNTPLDNLSLAPGTDVSDYTEYVVIKPITGVEKVTIAPWFDKPGGGIQFKLPMTIRDLIREGYIIPKQRKGEDYADYSRIGKEHQTKDI